MKLHLGVVDIPYSTYRISKRRKVKSGTQTTGDVAGFLENRYHVMEHFAEAKAPEIASALENSIQGALETVLMGGSPSTNAFASAESKIEEGFRRFLEQKELDKLGYPGIPTKASLEGRSLRFANKRGPVRPSFVDTGQYSASFKSWVTE